MGGSRRPSLVVDLYQPVEEEQPASAGDGQQRSQIDEDQASMWPALYMLEAYVRLFSSLPVV